MSTAGHPIFTAARAASRKEKGGTPEDARQKESKMEAVVEARPVGKVSPINIAGFHTESARRKLGIWLDSLVEKAKEKPVVQMVRLTPEMAEMLLGRNNANRRLSAATVENYAHEMRGGRWVFNGEPLIISDTGELNDGQHRCQAVIDSGVAVEVLLVVGIPRETRTTLDQGKTRTVGDYLSMEGHAYANVLGSAAGYVWMYRNRGSLITGGNRRQARATKGEVMQTVADNPGIERSVAIINQKAADAVGGKSILAFAHFIFATFKREDADYFIGALMNGAGLKNGNPILYVRNRLINERGRLKANDKAELLIKGWNAWRRGDTVTRLLLSGGTLPLVEG